MAVSWIQAGEGIPTQRGDVVVAISRRSGSYFATRVSNPTPPAGAGTIDVTALAATEGSPLQVWLYRGGGSEGTISVDYSTADDTAIAGLDYNTVNGTVTFATGEYLKSISIPTLNIDLPLAEIYGGIDFD